MPDSRIGHLLNNLPELQPLKRELTRFAALQNALGDIVPGNLATNTNVASVTAGELLLFADNGTIAAKLRQMAPRILMSLCQRGYELTGIRIQVQVRMRYNPLQHKQIYLSPEAGAAVDSLAEQLEPSPLRDALRRLGRRCS